MISVTDHLTVEAFAQKLTPSTLDIIWGARHGSKQGASRLPSCNVREDECNTGGFKKTTPDAAPGYS